jgi:transposase
MDYISGFDRNQMTCFMGCMDELIDEDNPVRFIDAYVDKLDLRSL